MKPFPCVVPGVGFPTSLSLGRNFSPRNRILWGLDSIRVPVDRDKVTFLPTLHSSANSCPQHRQDIPTSQQLPCSSLLPLRLPFLPFPLQGFLLLTGPFAPRGCQTSPSTCCPLQLEGTGFCISRTRWLLFHGDLPMESALSLVLSLCPDDDDDDFYFLSSSFSCSCPSLVAISFHLLPLPWISPLEFDGFITCSGSFQNSTFPLLPMRAFCSCMKSPPL